MSDFSGSRISRLVWTLTAVGIGAGVLTMGINYQALLEIRKQRANTIARELDVLTALRELRLERESAVDTLQFRLSNLDVDNTSAERPLGNLEDAVTRCAELLRHHESVLHSGAGDLRAVTQALQDLSELQEEIALYRVEAVANKHAYQDQ